MSLYKVLVSREYNDISKNKYNINNNMKLNEVQAYHGSGVDFDRFDVRYIGSGEGATAHGWGLYFSILSDVAKGYNNKLSKKSNYQYKEKVYKPGSLAWLAMKYIYHLGKKDAKSKLKDILTSNEFQEKYPKINDKIIDKVINGIDNIDVKEIHQIGGQIYQVEIPDLDYFLDEQLPLSKQSNYVKEIITQIMNDMGNKLHIHLDNTGKYFYRQLFYNKKSKKRASLELYKYGIKGIKYRGKEDGDCVIIFNSDDIKIIKKYFEQPKSAIPYNNTDETELFYEDDTWKVIISDLEYIFIDKRNKDEYTFNFKRNKIIDKDNNYIVKEEFFDKLPKELIQKFQSQFINNISINPLWIKYIENPAEDVQMKAVKYFGFLIEYIKNPSEEVQIEAVKQNGTAISYIKNPSEKVQLEAVKKDPISIMYIKNPTEKVQMEAVKQSNYVIHHIKNPTNKVKEYVKNHS